MLLYEAQQVAVVMLYPWLLWPGAFVILTVLAFSFLGDGLRDAADPTDEQECDDMTMHDSVVELRMLLPTSSWTRAC